jgi:hypothetical protein
VPRLQHWFFDIAAFASMNYLIFCFNILFLGIVAYVFRDRGEMRIFYWPALVVKVLAGIAVGLIYFYYYGVGDTLIFYEDGKILADVARRDFLHYVGFLWNENTDIDLYNQLASQDRSLFMVKIVSLFSFFTGNNYWLISTYFSILSFFSCWFLRYTGNCSGGNFFIFILSVCDFLECWHY